ncbi:GyrI-like domain-containing protein [Methylocapsa polymorpha]|uniref:GyrI-like domain-containing protein n=1 Tax=Methylocapsa polymorpha TaxID=3080828 RepID=A0ABZ0HYX1_9HYPH|nr:GyrI-like domain-containing protein [Methylocapsa sp. RX1]
MRLGEFKGFAGAALALVAVLVLLASLPSPAVAQTRLAAADKTAPVENTPSTAQEPESPNAPGIPSDATTVTLDVPARPVALLSGDSDWANGFKSIIGAIEKVDAAVKTAGLTPTGRPFAVFLSTDDNNFHFEAMAPIAEKPEGKTELTDGVKLGVSPSGKAIKFLHRGSYDDIDSTYDLITAFLDEKGLEAKNLFVEEYLTDTKDSGDASLEADIYVFLK